MNPHHLLWPVRLAPDGQFMTAPEGSPADLASQAGVVAVTPKGDRPLVPTFGLTSPIGTLTVDADEFQTACDQWVGPGQVRIMLDRQPGRMATYRVEVPHAV